MSSHKLKIIFRALLVGLGIGFLISHYKSLSSGLVIGSLTFLMIAGILVFIGKYKKKMITASITLEQSEIAQLTKKIEIFQLIFSLLFIIVGFVGPFILVQAGLPKWMKGDAMPMTIILYEFLLVLMFLNMLATFKSMNPINDGGSKHVFLESAKNKRMFLLIPILAILVLFYFYKFQQRAILMDIFITIISLRIYWFLSHKTRGVEE